jgi:hypothetical protein
MAGPPPPYNPPPPPGPPPGYGPQPPVPYGYSGPSAYGFPPGYGYPPPRRRRRITPLGIFLLLLVLLVVAVIGGAVALFTGAISTATLKNLVGLGPAQVQITNLRDGDVSALLQKTNPDGTTVTSTSALKSLDVRVLDAAEAGRFKLTVSDASGSTVTECSIDITSGSKWEFVLLDQSAIVTKNGEKPAAPNDVIVSTSSLCR